MANQDVIFGGIGRLDERERSAMAARAHAGGHRVLPWQLGPSERRRIHALGLATLGRIDERGCLASILTDEGIALGEILRRRGVEPMEVLPRPWE